MFGAFCFSGHGHSHGLSSSGHDHGCGSHAAPVAVTASTPLKAMPSPSPASRRSLSSIAAPSATIVVSHQIMPSSSLNALLQDDHHDHAHGDHDYHQHDDSDAHHGHSHGASSAHSAGGGGCSGHNHGDHGDHGDHSDHGDHGGGDLNMRALFLHFLADSLSSLCVLGVGLALHFFPDAVWVPYVDPASSLVIVGITCSLTVPLIRQCVAIVLQGTPDGVDLVLLARELRSASPRVAHVHALRCWTLNGAQHEASVHVRLWAGSEGAGAGSGAGSSSRTRQGKSKTVESANEASETSALVADTSDVWLPQTLSALRAVFHRHNVHSTSIQTELIAPNAAAASSAAAVGCVEVCTPQCLHRD
jgi:Co/Zn/Cd efflux system component